jgi:hypothetical protein
VLLDGESMASTYIATEPLEPGMTVHFREGDWKVTEVRPRTPGRLFDADVLFEPMGAGSDTTGQ